MSFLKEAHFADRHNASAAKQAPVTDGPAGADEAELHVCQQFQNTFAFPVLEVLVTFQVKQIYVF